MFGSITTGASNDIEQATKLARAMLTRYGMSKEFDMVALETVNNQYLGGDTSLACSAQTQREIDQRVVELVKAQHEKAVKILTDNRAKLDELAKYLYEKETITGDEFMAILEEKRFQRKLKQDLCNNPAAVSVFITDTAVFRYAVPLIKAFGINFSVSAPALTERLTSYIYRRILL